MRKIVLNRKVQMDQGSSAPDDPLRPGQRKRPRPRKVLFVGNLPYGRTDPGASGASRPPPQAHPPIPQIDYRAIAELLGAGERPLSSEQFLNMVVEWCEAYTQAVGDFGDLLRFTDEGTTYIFDYTSGSRPENRRPTEDRVVAAWRYSTRQPRARDKSRMKGFPIPEDPERPKTTQRGHLFAHAMGGGLDVGLFPQDADLNMGRSDQGKLFRRMETQAASNPGTFCFIRLLYSDHTWRPTSLEYGLLLPDRLWVEHFVN